MIQLQIITVLLIYDGCFGPIFLRERPFDGIVFEDQAVKSNGNALEGKYNVRVIQYISNQSTYPSKIILFISMKKGRKKKKHKRLWL